MFVGAIVVMLLVLVFMSLFRPALEERHRADCAGLRMAQVLFACAEYRDTHGSLPPAYIEDENGRRMHSWRVLILPYLGYNDLYGRYDFNEPWDGPSNRLLAEEMPREYQCPGCRGRSNTTTNFLAVVGPLTAWPGKLGVRKDQLEGKEAETVLLVEIADSDINWMSPHDMAYDRAIIGVNVDRQAGISSNHPGGANVGFIDGSVNFLRENTVGEELTRLLILTGTRPVKGFERND